MSNALFKPTIGLSKDEIKSYAWELDAMDWHSYDFAQWPAADLTFPDLVEGSEQNLWPFKPNLNEAHWVDLNHFKSGAQRKLYTIQHQFDIPDAFEPGSDWKEVDAVIAELQDLRKNDAEGFQEGLEEYEVESITHFEWLLEVCALSKKASYAEHQKLVNKAHAEAEAMTNANIEKVRAGGDLDPFKGIALEDWAAANAKMANGTSIDEILSVLAIEQPLWDEVTAEWNARMSRDTTASIATVYGRAFTDSNIGKFSGITKPGEEASNTGGGQEIGFEKWVEVQEAMNAGTEQGIDAGTVLKGFGLTEMEWSSLGAKMSQMMATDASLFEKFSEYSEKYNAMYATASAADDIDF